MTKDEMKNRISMALKDPILQQGFEIICKENAQLKEANETFATMNNGMWVELEKKRAESQGITNRLHQLIKAKSVIKKFYDFVNNGIEYDPENSEVHTKMWNELCEQAEQFLSEVK